MIFLKKGITSVRQDDIMIHEKLQLTQIQASKLA